MCARRSCEITSNYPESIFIGLNGGLEVRAVSQPAAYSGHSGATKNTAWGFQSQRP